MNPPVTEEAHFTTRRDFHSLLKSPKFFPTVARYQPLNASPNIMLILDVRQVDVTQHRTSGVSQVGFALMPLFDSHGFPNSGSFQLPLFEGPVLLELLEKVKASSGDAWQEVLTWIRANSKKIKQERNHASVFVRVFDTRLDDENRLDPVTAENYKDVDKRFLPSTPSDLKQYAYEKLPKNPLLSSVVPKKGTQDDYERAINDLIAKETGITRYAL